MANTEGDGDTMPALQDTERAPIDRTGFLDAPADFDWNHLTSDDFNQRAAAMARLLTFDKMVRMPAGMLIPLTPGDAGPICRAPIFDIANGPDEAVCSLILRPSIPRKYHWPIIEDIVPEDAVSHVDTYIKLSMHELSEDNPDRDSADLIRKKAIVLGATRAITTSFYKISNQSLNPSETYRSGLRYVPGAGGGTAGPAHMSMTEALAPGLVHLLMTNLAYTEVEKNVLAVLLRSQVGALPVSGYSLVMTGHHYLSDPKTQSRKAYDAMEKQHWKGAGVDAWFREAQVETRDMAWHKACHPIDIALKQRLARSEEVKRRLLDAGSGSAAVRLPAMEVEYRVATTYMALIGSVRTLFMAGGRAFNYSVLTEAIEAVDAFAGSNGVRNPGWERPSWYPEGVNTRAAALKVLDTVTKRNADAAAYVYGFYMAVTEDMMATGTHLATNTLKDAYSLSKLKENCYASFIGGFQVYEDVKAARALSRREGRVSFVDIIFE